MRRSRSGAVFAATTLILFIFPGLALAEKPPEIPAWHDGDVVTFTVVNENVEGKNAPTAGDVAIPLYAFGEPGSQPQFDVLAAVPGESDYNPWWNVLLVVVLDGRDVSTDPFTSEEEILAAAEAGEVLIIDLEFVFLCQVLSGANR